MKILQLIGALIDYPTPILNDNVGPMLEMVEQDKLLSLKSKAAMSDFIRNRTALPLLDWQAEYDGLFEKGRSLSLLLFEHVHGESRDRGQAMVDLMKNYQQAGLEISVNELPDFIPLYLEFLSTQGDENAKSWLQDVVHIFGLLSTRLHKRESNYAVLFEALIELSGVELDLSEVVEQVAQEKPDHTQEAIDEVWEEEAVTFGGDATNGGCPSSVNRPTQGQSLEKQVPINWMDAAQNTQTAPSNRV